MKKKLAMLMIAVMTLTAAFGITGCQKSDKGSSSSDKIGVLYLVENTAFEDMKNGIVDELKANGYDNLDVQCAQ